MLDFVVIIIAIVIIRVVIVCWRDDSSKVSMIHCGDVDQYDCLVTGFQLVYHIFLLV